MKKSILHQLVTVTLIFCFAITLVGCANRDGQSIDTASKYGRYPNSKQSNMVRGLANPRTEQSTRPLSEGHGALSTGVNATTQHTNEILHYWPDVSRNVDQLDGIAVAHVFITNKNAYVGLIFEDKQDSETFEKKGITTFHRHEVAPRSIAAVPYDHFYEVDDDDKLTNQLYHDVGRLVSNYAAPRQVFISDNEQFVHRLADFAMYSSKNISLQPLLHDFNVLVRQYFVDSTSNATQIEAQQ